MYIWQRMQTRFWYRAVYFLIEKSKSFCNTFMIFQAQFYGHIQRNGMNVCATEWIMLSFYARIYMNNIWRFDGKSNNNFLASVTTDILTEHAHGVWLLYKFWRIFKESGYKDVEKCVMSIKCYFSSGVFEG